MKMAKYGNRLCKSFRSSPSSPAPLRGCINLGLYIARVCFAEGQSSGYGRQIYKVLEARAKEFGYTHLCLNTHKFLTKGCAFWKRHGYIEFYDMLDEWHTIWLSKELV